MTRNSNQFAQLFLRIALSFTMLSAVFDRFGFVGENATWGNWDSFEQYVAELTFFLPEKLSVFSAYSATFLEIIFPIMLLTGFKTKIAAFGTGVLILTFALSMTLVFGYKTPLDYSVWIGSASAFLLASQQTFLLSLDQLIIKNK